MVITPKGQAKLQRNVVLPIQKWDEYRTPNVPRISFNDFNELEGCRLWGFLNIKGEGAVVVVAVIKGFR
jgi:hypothetical protein